MDNIVPNFNPPPPSPASAPIQDPAYTPQEVPPEARRWNWGAFLLTWIWGLGNGTYNAFLVFIPVFGIIWVFVLGFKGGEWAWKNRHWDSVEHFKSTQRKWAIAGLIFLLVPVVIMVFVVIAMVNAARDPSSAGNAIVRDATRLNNVRSVMTSLELYYNDNGKYPSSLNLLVPTYLGSIPTPPTPPDGNCNVINNSYVYIPPSETNSSYSLTFCLGSPVAGYQAGVRTASSDGVK
jgi:hypothetical protein